MRGCADPARELLPTLRRLPGAGRPGDRAAVPGQPDECGEFATGRRGASPSSGARLRTGTGRRDPAGCGRAARSAAAAGARAVGTVATPTRADAHPRGI